MFVCFLNSSVNNCIAKWYKPSDARNFLRYFVNDLGFFDDVHIKHLLKYV